MIYYDTKVLTTYFPWNTISGNDLQRGQQMALLANRGGSRTEARARISSLFISAEYCAEGNVSPRGSLTGLSVAPQRLFRAQCFSGPVWRAIASVSSPSRPPVYICGVGGNNCSLMQIFRFGQIGLLGCSIRSPKG